MSEVPLLPSSVRNARPFSLATRLTVWYAVSAFTVVLTATGFLYWVLTSSLDRQTDEVLADQVLIIRKLLHDRPADAAALKQEVEWEWGARQHVHIYVRILDEHDHAVMETPSMNESLGTEVFPEAFSVDAEPGPGETVTAKNGTPFRVLSVQAAVVTPNRPVHTLQVAVDRSREEALLADYRRSLWLILGLALVACSVGGYQIASRGIRPVQVISGTAQRIRSTTLNERLKVTGLPAELAELAVTFNDMLDRLEESFVRLARFSADIAHELRTPVNNLRGECEVTLGRERSSEEYRDMISSCLEEAIRLSRMIDSLLFLARAENPRTEIVREMLEVGSELAKVQEFYEAAASECGIQLKMGQSIPVVALLNRPLFQRAVGNLVENALAHTPSGGTITLDVTRVADSVRVEVTDTGCGIPQDHLPYIFDRFYRVDQARTSSSGGMGLGLAIVKSIVALHGGSVWLESKVSQGTRAVLLVPYQSVSGNVPAA